LNPRLAEQDYDFYLKNCNASFGIFAREDVSKFERIFKKLSIQYMLLDNNDIELYKTKNLANKPPAKLGFDNRPAFCLYTSGTTGHPSAVVHRHKDIRVTNENYVKYFLSVNEMDVLFSTSKMFFAYGLNSICYALYHGAAVILSPQQLDPISIWQMIKVHKPTIFFSVPTQYYRLLNNRPDHAVEYSNSVKFCVSAGEHLPFAIRNSWKELTNKIIIDGIGTTEILSTFISNHPHDKNMDSTGKVVPGFEISIRNKQQKEVSIDQKGILWVKGDTYKDSYLNHDEATRYRFVDGWFNSGDIFSRDKDGYFYYHGRSNDLIKSGGRWIYPYRIESILNQFPAVSECAVVSEVIDGLTRLVAHVALNKDIKPCAELVEELKNFTKKHCSSYEYPHFIKFITEIPKTPTGKLQRFKLKQNLDDNKTVNC
jgi:acetyl-CoA synthetase